ncbi:MAG: ribonuclease III [Pyrinomonadaceae bacterium]
MSANLGSLERDLGYKFNDVKLLERALTHRSWAHENHLAAGEESVRQAHNESFEFVGDSVLGLVIAEELFIKNPTLAEGDLTLMKHRLVSTATLAKVAAELDLGKHLRVGYGEEKTGGRKKRALLANTLEAVIGAVFFDGGYVKARHFIKSIFRDELKAAKPETSVDYKTLLQEKLQARKSPAPEYNVIKTEGKPHNRTFSVEAVWETGRSEGTGRSIKAAEMMAACEALKILESSGWEHDHHETLSSNGNQ